MSSHREAPSIAHDPAADNTDVYAFVSPDAPNTVTLIANYIPLQEPAGGPYFHNFSDDVLYAIYVDNDGDGKPDVRYEFEFKTTIVNPNTFLYNTGPITSLTDADWNFRQTYTVTRVTGESFREVIGVNLPLPPANIGPRSTPNYAALAATAVHNLPSGEKVFAGPRADPFPVDTGSIFDLAALRPLQGAHLVSTPGNTAGVNGLGGFNVHTIAVQAPKTELTAGGVNPTDPMAAESVIGVWASASRRSGSVREDGNDHGRGERGRSANAMGNGGYRSFGGWKQVSRLGEPLINEVIIPVGLKDHWNTSKPANDEEFVEYYRQPELAKLLPVLYPGAFPRLAALNASGAARADLVAILLTGIPAGLIAGFQNNTGDTLADELRLNLAIPPGGNNRLGLVGGDLAGFPNGRRLIDDVVDIELRAVAGAVYGLIDPTFTPDDVVSQITDGVDAPAVPFLSTFPYVGTPNQGYSHGHHESA